MTLACSKTRVLGTANGAFTPCGPLDRLLQHERSITKGNVWRQYKYRADLVYVPIVLNSTMTPTRELRWSLAVAPPRMPHL